MSVKSLLVILCVLIMSACKLGASKKDNEVVDINSYQPGDAIRTARFLNTNERQTGAKICRDLRDKRNRWEVSRNNLDFNFNVRSRTSCGGSLSSYSVSAQVEIASGELVLNTSSRNSFMKEILTDEHPALTNICDELIAGQNDTENTIVDSGSRYQVTFYEISGGDYALITRFLPDASGVFRASLIDESFVITKTGTSNSDLVGAVYKRAQQARCTSGGSTYVEQQMR